MMTRMGIVLGKLLGESYLRNASRDILHGSFDVLFSAVIMRRPACTRVQKFPENPSELRRLRRREGDR